MREGVRALPFTDGQQEVFLAAQMSEDGSRAFNLSTTLHIRGRVDTAAVERSLHALVARHESLRTVVDTSGLALTVGLRSDPQLSFEDLSVLPPEARPSRLSHLRREAVATPFDLREGPLFRATLSRLAEEEHMLILTAHHIVVDPWSLNVLRSELAALYDAEGRGSPAELPSPPQLGRYVEWYEARRKSEERAAAERYWLLRFQNPAPPLDLPRSHPRPARRTYVADRLDQPLSPDLCARLDELAGSVGATMSDLLLAAFQVLTARLSGARDVVVGISTAGQVEFGGHGLVGHCAHFLPLRMWIDLERPFVDWLTAVRDEVAEAERHQAFPFGALLPKLRLPRDPARPALVSVTFATETVQPMERFGRAEATVLASPTTHSHVELACNIVEADGGYEAQWTYNTSLFTAERVEDFARCYETLLDSIAADAATPTGRLRILSTDRLHRIVEGWNETARAFDSPSGLHELVSAQTARTPDAIAVTCGGEHLTYGQLQARSDQLARYLVRRGVEKGAVVGLCVQRTVELPVALLGILKAGAAYLPLDPEYPRERLDFMLSDARARVLVTESGLVGRLSAPDEIVSLDGDRSVISEERAEPLQGNATSRDDVAYVIYTSGSTGLPNGVCVPHGAVTNFLNAMASTPGADATDVAVAVTTLSFDIAVLELFLPLIVGGRVVITPRDVASDGKALRALLESESVTLMQATPSTWRLLLDAGWPGATGLKALVGGEALPVSLASALRERTRSAWNMYGPTETTVWSTCWQIEAPERGILIGRPIANTRTYILDAFQQPVPAGVTGELYIGGNGVALGYLNREELTRARFLDDPFRSGARMYRTGDLARHTGDGRIEWVGRVDHQVKVRGFRIELGEIESALLEHEGVSEVVVSVTAGTPGDERLVAYLVLDSATAPTPTELRSYLRSRLPPQMVPHFYVEIDEVPLTPNGKVDRRALEAMSPLRRDAGSAEPPVSPSERLVAAVWSETLGARRVGRHDNFFDLGGHSLLALQAIARIEDATGTRLPPRLMVFQNLAQIAAELDQPAA